MTENKDADLIVQYLNGNVQALEQLVNQYRRPLFKFILNMIDSQEEAEEIFQEVWFRVIRNLDKYKNDKFLSWMFRIARNFIIDRFRIRKSLVSLDKVNDAGLSLKDKIPADKLSPATLVEHKEIGRKIARAVALLPLEQKEVFLMRMEGSLSFKEIAGIQRVSINTALARMQYALEKLRIALRDECQEWSMS